MQQPEVRPTSGRGYSNEDWLNGLRPPPLEAMVRDLRRYLIRGLRSSLAGKVRGDLNDIVEDFAQEALLKILASLESFRGESRFITWAQKIAVRVAVVEMRRKRWQDVSFDEMVDDMEQRGAQIAATTVSPEERTTQQVLMEQVQRIIDEELTERQRETIYAFTFHLTHGVPLDELARRYNTNRNAFYKLLHDSKKKLRKRLEAQGITLEDVY